MEVAERGEGSARATAPQPRLYTALASATELPLAEAGPEMVPPPRPADRAGHRRGGLNKTAVVIHVTLTARDRGVVRLAHVGELLERHPFQARGARSPEEAVLVGYLLGIRIAARRGAPRVVVRVRLPTLEGYLHRGWRIRSPAVMQRWETLLAAVDRLPVEVCSVTREGERIGWSGAQRSRQADIE